MTPQEKALKLCQIFGGLGIDLPETNYYTFGISSAKKMALIVVDELLGSDSVFSNIPETYYWQQVKEEIEKI